MYTHKLGQEDIIFELNDWMSHAESSVIASMGDTKVMVAVALGGPTDKDYMPLKVEYQERYYARGEILGGKYNKREGRPSTEATLTARLIDRAVRPFFPKDFNRDILIVVTVLSLGDHDPDVVALNATSLALEISSIPWRGFVGAVRVSANEDGEVLSPTYKQRAESWYEATVAARDGRLCMLETEASQTSEPTILSGISLAIDEVAKLDTFLMDIISEHKKEKIELTDKNNRLENVFKDMVTPLVLKDISGVDNKKTRDQWFSIFKESVGESFEDATYSEMQSTFDSGLKDVVRSSILNSENRIDGRDLDTVRSIYAQAGGVSDVVHGSGLFYRGETHVLSVATLGQLDDSLHIDGMEINADTNFIHHYNFPPYSVGEVGRMGSPGRREIGHGALAEKAFRRVIPSPEDFPYTMRVVSEVLSSNGSTSMGSTCGTSLALHDVGVPLPGHVAGVAIGLVYESDNNYKILSDILGKEDHYGDMDFKVAGTRKGITAIQLDCKFDGLSKDMITETLEQAKQGRSGILDVMEKELKAPRDLSPHVEKIKRLPIPDGMVGLVIGKGGVTIKKITADSGAKIDIKRDGTAFIIGKGDSIQKAEDAIKQVLSTAKETK